MSDTTPHPLPAALIHDLRTPLGHIIGYAEMLMEELEDAGRNEFLPHAEKVRAAGYHLLALMEETLVPAEHAREPAPAGAAEAAAPETYSPVAFYDHRTTGDAPFDSAPGLLLVVDDVEANRDVLSRRLERQGYAVATAVDGAEALGMLGAGSYDLVLLDVMMPGMDGFEVLRRLKADERLRNVPVVMISAVSELDTVARCIELGAEDYLAKPFHPALLQARVRACLARKRTHDQEMVALDRLREDNRRLRAREQRSATSPDPGGAGGA